MFLSLTVNGQSKDTIEPFKVFSSFSNLEEEVLLSRGDTVVIINFWASWCKPCIKEIPYFEELQKLHQGKYHVTLVSLDNATDIDSKLKNFVSKNIRYCKICVLTDSRAVDWIDRVDKSWSGSIPATIVIKDKKKIFYERDFESYDVLYQTIENDIKSNN